MPNAPFLAPERDSAYKLGRAKQGATTYYGIPGQGFSTITTGGVANGPDTDYYQPFVVQTPVVIDQLAVEVATLASGKNIRFGLYTATTDWQPTGGPLADSGDVSVTTTGAKTYTPATPIYLPRGRYLSVHNNNDDGFLLAMRVFRSPHFASLPTALGANMHASFFIGRAYAAFPSPGTAWTSVTTGSAGREHVVVFRMSGP